MEYLILILLWVLFYFLHSFLASITVKSWAESKLGLGKRWYRLLYSIGATFHLLLILIHAGGIPEKPILVQTTWVSYLGYMFAAFGTIIIVKAFQHISVARFVGLREEKTVEKPELIISGIYAYVRHPIYSGLILIFLGYFFFNPVISSLIHFAGLLIYLPIGIYLEEQKLIKEFGNAYLQYKEQVNALIPLKVKKTA